MNAMYSIPRLPGIVSVPGTVLAAMRSRHAEAFGRQIRAAF